MARLIDTTVLIDFERREQPIGVLRDLLAEETLAISSITASELLLGMHRTDSIDRRQRREAFVESVFSDIPVLPFDLYITRIHAQLSAQLLAMGRVIAQNDLMIAATALAHDYAIFTHNLHDFQRVPDQIVEAPDW
jgi:predicted nucleic acid-binding protein